MRVCLNNNIKHSSHEQALTFQAMTMKAVASGRLELVICACLQPPLAQPPCQPIPSRPSHLTSLSANPAHPPPQKAKALPGSKTYENDAHISLRLSIAEQLHQSGVHLITNAPLRKQGKVNMYQNNVLSPTGCMYGLTPYTCEDLFVSHSLYCVAHGLIR